MDTTDKLPAPGIEAFFTRARAADGVKLPLHTPEGNLTAHWVRVRGVDCDEFQAALNASKRKASEISEIKDADERENALLESSLELHAALVSDWSFSDAERMGDAKPIPCTVDNIKNFLRNAPQIARQIDNIASNRRFFFKLQANNSQDTPPHSSD